MSVRERLPTGCTSVTSDGGGKLRRNDFGHSEIEHLSGKGEAHEQTNPFLEVSVARSPIVDNRPDRRKDDGDDQQPADLNPMERRVPAVARVDERPGDMEQMRCKPECDVTHGPARPQAWECQTGKKNQPADDLRGEGIQREVHGTEAEDRSSSRSHPVWHSIAPISTTSSSDVRQVVRA